MVIRWMKACLVLEALVTCALVTVGGTVRVDPALTEALVGVAAAVAVVGWHSFGR